MDSLLSARILELRGRAHSATRDHIAPNSAQVDSTCEWPAHSIRALSDHGLMGLHVPERLGGQGEGLLALAVLSETIATGCASSAMCYAMHCVGTAVIATKATPDQAERYLTPIAQGHHVTTLALSETGTGAHFYLPQTLLERRNGALVVNGTKQFVTNAGHADSYVVSTKTASGGAGELGDPGAFSCLVVDRDTPGVTWGEPWLGFGLRGNSSRSLSLTDASVPVDNLLGREGDQVWYIFEVVAPYFLMAMAGTYLGVAQRALDITIEHMRTRRHDHSLRSLADIQILQHHVADLWLAVQKTRNLVYHAGYLGDRGAPDALPAILAAKADAGETAVRVANEAMTRCGGMAYRDNAELARLLRDARASHVMSPTTDILKVWLGRSLLGLPLL